MRNPYMEIVIQTACKAGCRDEARRLGAQGNPQDRLLWQSVAEESYGAFRTAL